MCGSVAEYERWIAAWSLKRDPRVSTFLFDKEKKSLPMLFESTSASRVHATRDLHVHVCFINYTQKNTKLHERYIQAKET